MFDKINQTGGVGKVRDSYKKHNVSAVINRVMIWASFWFLLLIKYGFKIHILVSNIIYKRNNTVLEVSFITNLRISDVCDSSILKCKRSIRTRPLYHVNVHYLNISRIVVKKSKYFFEFDKHRDLLLTCWCLKIILLKSTNRIKFFLFHSRYKWQSLIQSTHFQFTDNTATG